MAAGFSIAADKIPLFRRRLNEYAKQKISEEDCVPCLEIEEYVSDPGFYPVAEAA